MQAGIALITALWAAPAMAGVAQGAEDGWITLREDSRVVWQMERAPAKGAGALRTVNLKRIFKGGWEERAYSLDKVEIDCAAKSYHYTGMVIYDVEGYVFHRYRINDKPTSVPSGSVLELALQNACQPANRPGNTPP